MAKEVRIYLELIKTYNGEIIITTGGGNCNNGTMETHKDLHSAIVDLNERAVVEYNLLNESKNTDMTNKYFYELCYFHSRKDSGSLYAKSNKNLKDFLGEDEFLDYLMKNKEITYSDAQSIVEIIEITEEEYEDFA